MVAGWVRHERDLWAAWRAQRWRDPPLRTADGAIQVVYPGRWSGGSGPDFRDAIVATESGELLRGDVEVHLRTSGWHAHGHGADQDYRGVVLHAVLTDDAPPIRRADGSAIPTCALDRHLLDRPPADGAAVAFFRSVPPAETSDLVACLRRLGEERFCAKSARFSSDLAADAPAHVLWTAVLDALGYARNRAPFRELAARVPWSHIEAHAGRLAAADRSPHLRAWLLGAAGFLDGRGDQATALRERWDTIRARIIGEALPPIRWVSRGVRPENAPARRAVAAACLASAALDDGLMSYLLAPFRIRDDGAPSPATLERPLLVDESPDIASALAALGLPAGRGALLGADRAGEIAVNVVLPFAHAWADLYGQRWLADCALDAFRTYRPLGGNEITRHLTREFGLAGRRDVRLGACHQQGILQVDAWHRQGAFDRLAEHGLLDRLASPLQLALFQ